MEYFSVVYTISEMIELGMEEAVFPIVSKTSSFWPHAHGRNTLIEIGEKNSTAK